MSKFFITSIMISVIFSSLLLEARESVIGGDTDNRENLFDPETSSIIQLTASQNNPTPGPSPNPDQNDFVVFSLSPSKKPSPIKTMKTNGVHTIEGEITSIPANSQLKLHSLYLNSLFIKQLTQPRYKENKDTLLAALNSNDPQKWKEVIFGPDNILTIEDAVERRKKSGLIEDKRKYKDSHEHLDIMINDSELASQKFEADFLIPTGYFLISDEKKNSFFISVDSFTRGNISFDISDAKITTLKNLTAYLVHANPKMTRDQIKKIVKLKNLSRSLDKSCSGCLKMMADFKLGDFILNLITHTDEWNKFDFPCESEITVSDDDVDKTLQFTNEGLTIDEALARVSFEKSLSEQQRKEIKILSDGGLTEVAIEHYLRLKESVDPNDYLKARRLHGLTKDDIDKLIESYQKNKDENKLEFKQYFKCMPKDSLSLKSILSHMDEFFKETPTCN